jgi:subtilase family serine protease
MLLVGSSVSSQVASRDRILQAINPAQTSMITGTAHPEAKPQFDQGRIEPNNQLNGAIVFRLSSAQQSELDRLLAGQQDRSSSSYHKWITPDQYAQRFGMSESDLAKASAWLKSQGLKVNGIARNHMEIYFSGTAAQLESAFRTEIHRYSARGEEHFANATPLSVPVALANVVLAVRGLDNFRPKPMSRVRLITGNRASAHFTSNVSGNHFVIPADFAVIYNLPSGLDGTGVKIAVTGQSTIMSSGNITTDLDNFRAASGLATLDPAFQLVPNTGSATYDSGDATEADLDLEWSNAVASNASVTFVYAGNNGSAFDAINYIVNQGLGLAQIISNSFGLCESQIGQSQANALWQIVRQANVQGQTMTSATGDSGAADCESANAVSASQGLAVDIPAAIPEVTGISGTEFTGDGPTTITGGCAAADSPYWAKECNSTDPNATALEYIPETSWNDSSSAGIAAGGGGASIFFAKPSWQSGPGVPADGARDVPDIALNASPNHDPYLICSQPFYPTSPPPVTTSCANGFRDSIGDLTAVGGTSAGAPTFAGILALIIQGTKATGLGNVNPILYSVASSSPQVFHDVTSGNNKVPCTSGTTDCPAGTTSIGFSAGPGYDQVTGLGSVDAASLETAWPGASASADFVMDAQTSSVTPGQVGTSTINVIAMNGFADTVNLTCTPSSTTAQISCSLNPISVTLSSSIKSVSSTLSITTVAKLEHPQRPGGAWFAATGGLFAAVLLGGVPSRRRWTVILGLLLLAITVAAIGCGGGSSSPAPAQKAQGTPAGTYTVMVTGTGANTGTAHSLTMSLTVQ